MHKKPTGFTLVELLVVIAIIALLIAILLPVLNKIRAQAKAVVCSSNIKQLFIALTSYEIQNGKFPYGFDSNSPQSKNSPPGGWPGRSDYDKQGWWWFNFVADFLGKSNNNKSVLWCPARSIKDSGPRKNILCGNFGVNQQICKNAVGNKGPEVIGAPLRATQIRRPAGTFLLADSGYATIMWWYATDAPPKKITSGIMDDSAYIPGLDKVNTKRIDFFRPGVDFDAYSGRHSQKSINSGFLDGHVVQLKAKDFYILKNSNDYENLSPLLMP